MTPDLSPRDLRSGYPPIWTGLVLFVLALAASAWFVGFVADTGERLERERVQALAYTLAATLDGDTIGRLRGVADEAGTPELEATRDVLRRARSVNADFRFVYLMRPGPDGQMRFLADAEAVDSPDYSAPGDAYDGPSALLRQVWRRGEPAVEPPARDRWGYWVTALAPVRAADGRVVAVLGMDVNADAWLATLARYRAFALAICGLVLALIVLFTTGLHLQRRAAGKLSAVNAELAARVDELQRAQAGLRLADVVFRHTGEAILVLDPELRVRSANPGFTLLTGHGAGTVVGAVPPVFGDDDILQQVRTRLQSGTHWEGLLWARRVDGRRFPIEAALDVVEDGGHAGHVVMVFRDVTVQKQLEDRLRELSATDGLTLLANRRAFDEALEREWHRAISHGEPLSLLMCDIDHFKAFNDLYGHVAGDYCLQRVAAALAAAVPGDGGALVARYGGEEFAVILPRTHNDAARAVAEQVRLQVEALDIAHAGHPAEGHVTLSVGVSTRTPPQTADVLGLMRSADQALYRAKESGRNAVAADAGEG